MKYLSKIGISAVFLTSLIMKPIQNLAAEYLQHPAASCMLADCQLLATPKAEGYLVLVNKTHPTNINPHDLEYISANEQLSKEAANHYKQLALAAEQAGFPLVVVSGYRPKEYQEQIYNQQIANYEAQGFSKEEATKKTNEYMMVPGTSEHQTGLAVDVLDEKEYSQRPELSPLFGETAGGQWLANNAYKYGFIIRYPKDKEQITKINYEPWHLRYVGIYNAYMMHKNNQCLEEYVNEK